MSLSSRSSSSSSGGCGGGLASRSQSQPVGYFAYRHLPGEEDLPPDFNPFSAQENNVTRDNRGNRKMGSVSVQDGALNLQIPCAFSYAYDVPVPPQYKKGPGAGIRNPCKPSTKIPHRTQKHPGRNTRKSTCTSNNNPCAPACGNVDYTTCVPPFVTTVKCGQLYKAPKVSPPVDCQPRTRNRISVVSDRSTGEIPVYAVTYGEELRNELQLELKELYEEAAGDLSKQLQGQKLADGKRPGSRLSDVEDFCFDYSKPGINSSRGAAKALKKATEQLNNIPQEVEEFLRKDSRFDAIIHENATKALNVNRDSKVYQDLIPVDPNPDVKTEAENVIQAEIKRSIEAARQPARKKDDEPKIEDFQSNSYTRIRPAPVPPPKKPSTGTSIEQNNDFKTIEDQTDLEDDSNQI